MPTGYTAKLCEGDQSFEDFVYTAARAMMPFIHMRDDRHDAQLRLPDPGWSTAGSIEEVRRCERRLAESEEEISKLEAMSEAEIQRAFDDYNQERLQEWEETCRKRHPIRQRLTDMRARVADWYPPTAEHEPFKKFLLQQINSTLEHDGNIPDKPRISGTAQDHHEAMLKFARRSISYAQERLQSEQDKPDVQQTRIVWIRELVRSIPPTPGIFAPGELEKLDG